MGTCLRIGEQPVLAPGHEGLAASFTGIVVKTAAAILEIVG
jgi:hypothetical protein